MNDIKMSGRVATDVTVRQTASGSKVANYRIAVDRRFKREGQQTADFFNCVVFGKGAEFAEKYLHKGIKIIVSGELRNANWQDSDGKMHYRDEIVVQNHEFCERKGAENQNYQAQNAGGTPAYANTQPRVGADGFMNIPDGVEEELPFS